jgi:hypothetical protein
MKRASSLETKTPFLHVLDVVIRFSIFFKIYNVNILFSFCPWYVHSGTYSFLEMSVATATIQAGAVTTTRTILSTKRRMKNKV